MQKNNFHIIFLCLCCYLLGNPTTAIAQLLKFRHYTTADGLLSSETFDIKQDKEGFIWITTDNGICKFDGQQFTPFPIQYFTNDLEIKLLPDRTGRLWVVDLQGQGAYYYKNQIIPLDNLIDFVDTKIDNVFEDKNGNIWFKFLQDKLIQFDPVFQFLEDVFGNISQMP